MINIYVAFPYLYVTKVLRDLIIYCTSNEEGNIHLAGSPDLGMVLPDPNDDNYPDGAKIGLVLSEDYDAAGTKMIAWNPAENPITLFIVAWHSDVQHFFIVDKVYFLPPSTPRAPSIFPLWSL